MSADDGAAIQLQAALSLLALPHVRDFLLSPDPLVDATILTNPVRRAASFPFALHRVVWGSPVLESQAHSRWLCAPAFSVDSVTVGVVVQRLNFVASPQLMKARPSGHAMLRFAVDANAGVLLTVSAESPAGTLDIQYAGFNSMSSRTSLNAVVRAQELREAIDNNFDSAMLSRALLFSFAHREQRTCALCARNASPVCTCAPTFPAPSHPLDFSAFSACMARALGDYFGHGSQQLAVHRGNTPICAKKMYVCLAVRHLANSAAVTALWTWAVQTRFAELPSFPSRVELSPDIDQSPRERNIVDELRALRDEEKCNNKLLLTASAGGSITSREPYNAAAVAPNDIQIPLILTEECERSPTTSRDSQLARTQRLNYSPCSLDPGQSGEAVTPPRGASSSAPITVKQQINIGAVVQEYESSVPNEQSVLHEEYDSIRPPSQPRLISQPTTSSDRLPQTSSLSYPISPRIVSEQINNATSAPQILTPAFPVTLSPILQPIPIANIAQSSVVSLPVTSPIPHASSFCAPSPQPLQQSLPGSMVLQPGAQTLKERPTLTGVPCGTASDSSSTGADFGHMPFSLQGRPVSVGSGDIKALQKPYPRRVASRIEKNPLAPPVQETTYVGERDRKLVDRRERNRKSAARSNLKRKQARETLARNLAEAIARKELLEQRQTALKVENETLKKSVVRANLHNQNLCEGAS